MVSWLFHGCTASPTSYPGWRVGFLALSRVNCFAGKIPGVAILFPGSFTGALLRRSATRCGGLVSWLFHGCTASQVKYPGWRVSFLVASRMHCFNYKLPWMRVVFLAVSQVHCFAYKLPGVANWFPGCFTSALLRLQATRVSGLFSWLFHGCIAS